MDPYTASLKKLYAKNIPRSMRWTLEGSQHLSKAFNEPHKAFPTIHVTGTNGKGSVCTKIAKSLAESGYKVGLYTSPHISTFRERIQINGEMIDKGSCATLLEELFQVQGDKISFFDYVTHLALLYFRKMGVDVAVIEVGVGGRLDSTNIISPILSIITTVGFDHCEYLGHSLAKIAQEKGGIIKPKTPILIGPDVPRPIIEKMAQEKNAPLHIIEERSPQFDEENQITAKMALELLKDHFDIKHSQEALKAKPPCRMTNFVHNGVDVLLDVAHNTHGIGALLRTIKQQFPQRELDIVFGLSASKDLAGCIKLLQQQARRLYPVQAKSRRAALVADLLPYLKMNSQPDQSLPKTLEQALTAAKEQNSLLVILGSIFLMEEVRDFFGIPQEKDPFELNEQLLKN